MLSDKAVQCRAVDAEFLGRKGQISALLVDRFLEELLFQLFESLFLPFSVAAEPLLTYSRHQDRLRKVLHGDERPRGIGQGPLNRVLNSRTFPGQSYCVNHSIASAVTPSIALPEPCDP